MYKIFTYITQPAWNNAFSYDQRIALWSEGKLYIPSLIQGTVAELQQGSDICFEEVIENKLVSCTGLKHFLQTTFHDTPVYIVDNHNHALSFRYEYSTTLNSPQSKTSTLNLLHIDQHSDIKPNENIFSEGDMEIFVNEKTNVGNFITAAINSWIIKDVIQIRTDYALQNSQLSTAEGFNSQSFILDIDIDFRQDKELTDNDINALRSLMQEADLVTIATSPYFIDQARAIDLIKKLLSD